MKIVFLATPKIAVSSLEYLANCGECEVLAVVTSVDKPQNRGKKILPPPIKIAAESLNIKVFQTLKISENLELIENLKVMKPDFFVTFAFGQILSKEILSIPKFATINLHVSKLPEYRGANPIARAIYDGKKETAITTMVTEEGLDTGDICLCKTLKIDKYDTTETLCEKISDFSPSLILQTLKGIEKGSVKPEKQDEKSATFAPKFKKEDYKINWTKTAQEIFNQTRAIKSFSVFKGKIIKIIKADFEEGKQVLNAVKGEIAEISKDGVKVQSEKGFLVIKKVLPEGKREMEAYSWALGQRIKKGDKFDL